jgi:hypothetical protein
LLLAETTCDRLVSCSQASCVPSGTSTVCVAAAVWFEAHEVGSSRAHVWRGVADVWQRPCLQSLLPALSAAAGCHHMMQHARFALEYLVFACRAALWNFSVYTRIWLWFTRPSPGWFGVAPCCHKETRLHYISVAATPSLSLLVS